MNPVCFYLYVLNKALFFDIMYVWFKAAWYFYVFRYLFCGPYLVLFPFYYFVFFSIPGDTSMGVIQLYI